ncbi:MAG: VOC family protein [Candidatus Dormibacteraeota bacterium]|nr:VOC family protein [Candidatus Dormibacteraeota bacterium]
MSATVVALAEIVLWMHDRERMLAFYRDLLGLRQMSGDDVPAIFLKVSEGPAGIPAMIVLSPHPEPGGAFPTEKRARPLHHLALNVSGDRYDTLRAALEASGLAVREGIHPVLKGVRTFYVDDPEGNEVEVIAPVL